jgi:hypothetical protein
MRRVLLLFLLMATGCVSSDLVRCSRSAPPLRNRFGSDRARAIALLSSAERLESSLIGPFGKASCAAVAYRHLVRRRDASAAFEEVFDSAKPAGKIYALAGLYDVDRAAFDRLVAAAEASSPETYEQLNTDVGTEPTRGEVFADLRSGNLSRWWRPAR